MYCPRPILKRAPSQHTSHAHAVHFPSSPLLTKTFDAPTYDRTPIVVAPNSCALPERGGRCYLLNDAPCPDLIPDESDESDDSTASSNSLLFSNSTHPISLPNTPSPQFPDYAFAQAPEKQLKSKKPKLPVHCDDLPFPPSPSPNKKKKRQALCKALSFREGQRDTTGGCLDGF